jgi:hypothetical protein
VLIYGKKIENIDFFCYVLRDSFSVKKIFKLMYNKEIKKSSSNKIINPTINIEKQCAWRRPDHQRINVERAIFM